MPKLFEDDKMSLGIVLPVQSRDCLDVDLSYQLRLAQIADGLGFSALWLRDVPLNSNEYPDPIRHSDPWTFAGALAAVTSRIHIVTGAIVLPLRHPLHVAKAALSLNDLSGGRFVLGLGSGDRSSEFAMFEREHDRRRELFRSQWARLEAALASTDGVPDQHAILRREFSLGPRVVTPAPIRIAVGSSGQSLEWIARNASGWATYHREPEVQRDRIALWRAAISKTTAEFRSFSQVMTLDLLDERRAPPVPIDLGYQLGGVALSEVLETLRQLGVHHIAFSLNSGDRAPEDTLAEIARDVMPLLR